MGVVNDKDSTGKGRPRGGPRRKEGMWKKGRRDPNRRGTKGKREEGKGDLTMTGRKS